MEYCVGIYIQCVVEADSADEAQDVAMEQATCGIDDVDFTAIQSVVEVEE